MSKMSIAVASLQGATSCYGDLPIEANPHDIRSDEYNAWNEGWKFALQQSVKEYLETNIKQQTEQKPAALSVVKIVRT